MKDKILENTYINKAIQEMELNNVPADMQAIYIAWVQYGLDLREQELE